MTQELVHTPKSLPKYAKEKRDYEGDPWSRQPHESKVSYEAFIIYLNLEPENRVIKQAGIEYRKQRGLRPSNNHASIYQWSKKHRWEERALAYDNYLAAKERAVLQRRKLKTAIKHADQIDEALEVLTAPQKELAKRLREQAEKNGVTFITELADGQLLQLMKTFVPNIAGLQKAERDAIDSATGDGGPKIDTKVLKARRDTLLRIIGDPSNVAFAERMTVELSEAATSDEDDD